MKRKHHARGFGQDTDVIPKLEGMEVEFDEKVTLFPVELEEIRDMAPKGSQRMVRGSKAMH
ncbi:MAG: hypothetical protein HY273_16275 [Gammaproteobacteria bacterium]|nr:hypothetical protein [Gammaproteobacteria bacterium]